MILEADEKMKIGGKEYKVRFTVKSIFNLEKELGESLLTERPTAIRRRAINSSLLIEI